MTYRAEMFVAGFVATLLVINAEPIGVAIAAGVGVAVTVARAVLIGLAAIVAVCSLSLCALGTVRLIRARRPAPPVPAYLEADGPRGAWLVSDADRDVVLAILQRAMADGYLDPDEYGDRTDEAMRARVRGDLAAILEGLPDPVAGR